MHVYSWDNKKTMSLKLFKKSLSYVFEQNLFEISFFVAFGGEKYLNYAIFRSEYIWYKSDSDSADCCHNIYDIRVSDDMF